MRQLKSRVSAGSGARERRGQRGANRMLAFTAAIVALSIFDLAPAVARSSSASGRGAIPASHLVRLGGELVPGLPRALSYPIGRPVVPEGSGATRQLVLTVVLRRDDQAGFTRFLAGVENPRSPRFRHFLTQSELAARFGPTPQAYAAVLGWLRARGFLLVQGSANRLTLTVRGTRAQASSALRVKIGEFRTGSGRRIYANEQNPALPLGIARHVQAITGLSDLARPGRAAPQDQNIPGSSCPTTNGGSSLTRGRNLPTDGGGTACSDSDLRNCQAWVNGADGALSRAIAKLFCTLTGHHVDPDATAGAGQKVGLVEFDNFHRSDVSDYLSLTNSPPTVINNVSEVNVGGGAGAPGPGETEVLLDIDSVLLLSGAAHITVYDAPASTSFAQMFNTMISDGDTVISNSWSACENQVSPAEAQAIDSVLAGAAASGISVVNGAGDSGSTCLDGSPNTVGVPADSPHATAVGGSTLTLGSGITYGSEAWWDGTTHQPQTGQGGFGVSRYFAAPSYQSGLTVAPGRSVPDIVAPADPAGGMQICQADRGGCPDGLRSGGTSLSAPEAAAFVADLNGQLGTKLGDVNAALYPLANSPAFHSATDMGSDFAHVGLGDPNLAQLAVALGHVTVGSVSAGQSRAQGLGATSILDVNGETVPADGMTHGTVQVALSDARGFPVSGQTVALSANAGSHAVISAASGPSDNTSGSVTFTVTDTTPETVTFTAVGAGVTLTAQPTLMFVTPAATGASIVASPPTVVNDGSSRATISVYLENALGRPAAGKTVTLSAGATSAVLSSSTAITGANGIATFTATDTKAETVVFTAIDTTDASLPVPGSATVNFKPAGPSSCVDTPPKPTKGSSVLTSRFASGVPENEYPITTFGGGITFTSPTCIGVETPAFGPSGKVYVPDVVNNQIYVFGAGGGAAGPATALPDTSAALAGGLVFGRRGELYASVYAGGDPTKPELVQLDPATGAVQRVIATSAGGLPDFPVYIAVDPISGDVFTVDDGSGSGTENTHITRIANPDSASPTVTPYADVGGTPAGLTFAPDGTLFVTVLNGAHPNSIVSVSATNSGSPGTVTPVVTLPNGPFGVGVIGVDTAGHATALVAVEDGGNIDRINLRANPATSVTIAHRKPAFSTGGAIGPDGCLYYDDQDQLLRVTGISPGCAPGGGRPGPQITLTDSGRPSATTGSSVTFTAQLSKFAAAPGTPVSFEVSGANSQVKLVNADSSGKVTFTLTGVLTGGDVVTASAANRGSAVTSAPLGLRWSAGRDVTFLDLNSSQLAGPMGQPATLTVTLLDISRSPSAPISGASVKLGLGARSCTANTNAAGVASCSVVPATIGTLGLTADYAGSGRYTASSAGNVFEALSDTPVDQVVPVISGTPTVAQLLTCSTGTWANRPTGFTYTWKRDGSVIAGATGPSYVVQTGDQGRALTCSVTAANAAGAGAPATSAAVSVPAAPGAPVNSIAPEITGTPAVGQTLNCSSGTWSDSPTFAWQWNRDGAPIAGATSPGYTVQEADQGTTLTCTVTAADAAGPGEPATSGGVAIPSLSSSGPPPPSGGPPPPTGSPVDTAAPQITGTPTPGNQLTCSTGTWTNSPTSYSYQWLRDGNAIASATSPTYVVQILDEARSLACTVTASNSSGSGTPSNSTAVLVALPGTLHCAKPVGRLHGLSLGVLRLGLRRSQARHKLSRFGVTRNNMDNFCLFAGWGIRAGYPSTKLLRSVSRAERDRVRGRIVLALTANPFYALDGARPGTQLAAARRLHPGKALRIGLNTWYFARGGPAHGIVKVRHGVIQEVGIAATRLTNGRRAQLRFLKSFTSA